MKKISIKVKITDQNKSILSLINKYKNISIFISDNFLNLELFFNNSEINNSLISNIKKDFDYFELIEIKRKNWITQNIKDDKGVETEFFHISQGLSEKINKRKKFKLIIPANNAFGTGSHESTFLAIILCIFFGFCPVHVNDI